MSCCEKAIRQENEYRDIYEEAVRVNEERIYGGRLTERQTILQHNCLSLGCDKTCKEHEDHHTNQKEEDSNDMLKKLRAQRLAELQANAKGKREKMKKGFASYTKITEQQLHHQLQKSSSILICHFYQSSDDLNLWVDEHIQDNCSKYMNFKFLKIENIMERQNFPSLVCFNEGSNISSLTIDYNDDDEPELIWDEIDIWLQKLADVLDNQGEEEEEEEVNKFCGTKKCGKYFPHEHVEWGIHNSMAQLGLDESKEEPYSDDSDLDL